MLNSGSTFLKISGRREKHDILIPGNSRCRVKKDDLLFN